MELVVLPDVMLRLFEIDCGLGLAVELVVECDGLVDVLRMIFWDRPLLVRPSLSPAPCIEAVRRDDSIIDIRIARKKADRILPISIRIVVLLFACVIISYDARPDDIAFNIPGYSTALDHIF